MDYKELTESRGEKYPDYLGYGVYASFDGEQIWLRAERNGGWHQVALDQNTFDALIRYHARVLEQAQRDAAGIN